ncbi:MAG: TIGR00730 family Rossman fold protein [Nitrospirota bacterium]|nr:TIGR00730 family Rossman fold protein [Nitrospirota bacterium]
MTIIDKLKKNDLAAQIDALLQNAGDTPNNDLYRELIVSVLRMAEDNAERGNIKIAHSALREMRYAFKVFGQYKPVRKISIFGSARTHADEASYKLAASFAERVVEEGFMVITGGGPGIMEAAQAGAGGYNSFGLNVMLPFEQRANPYIADDPKLINFKYFFTRKLFFVKESCGLVLFPGGFGTMDEGFEAMTLIQTGKADIKPVVLMDEPGSEYWKDWREYVDEHLEKRGLISEEDWHLLKITNDIEEAVGEFVRFYRNYHSSRYVRDKLVLRLKHKPTPQQVESLNDRYSDIVSDGHIIVLDSLPEEQNEPDIAHMPRLVFAFNRKNMGRLRQLIDELNGMV